MPRVAQDINPITFELGQYVLCRRGRPSHSKLGYKLNFSFKACGGSGVEEMEIGAFHWPCSFSLHYICTGRCISSEPDNYKHAETETQAMKFHEAPERVAGVADGLRESIPVSCLKIAGETRIMSSVVQSCGEH